MSIDRLGKGWDKLGLRSTGMHILLSFSDGNGALLQSPKGKTIRIGLKARFGWMIVLLGCWIMFGENKKWTTATGPVKQKTVDEMVRGFTEGGHMKAEKIIASTEPCEINVLGITLLSKEEYEKYSEIIPNIGDWWWLRSPGRYQDLAAGVGCVGSIYSHYVDCGSSIVRPALIANLEFANLKSGDKIILAGHKWTVLNEQLALCDDIVGRTCFRHDLMAKDANDYEKSDIKKWLEYWAKEKGLIA